MAVADTSAIRRINLAINKLELARDRYISSTLPDSSVMFALHQADIIVRDVEKDLKEKL